MLHPCRQAGLGQIVHKDVAGAYRPHRGEAEGPMPIGGEVEGGDDGMFVVGFAVRSGLSLVVAVGVATAV